jgi:hypothetical protein
MYSIYSFWKDIIGKKDVFKSLSVLRDFPFNPSTFSYIRKGKGFPDFAIKTNQDRSLDTGGEFILLKSRNNYSIAPFKSVIPSGKVKIKALFGSSNSGSLQQQWQNSKDEYSLEERDVYFLIRGQKGNHQKICLVHGSFFETIGEKELFYQSFVQPLEESLSARPQLIQVQQYLRGIALKRKNFDNVADIEKASVNFKFSVIAEVKPEGNILNSKMYPEILDDTINLVVPYHSDDERTDVVAKVEMVIGQQEMENFRALSIKHPFNGWFVVFQVSL